MGIDRGRGRGIVAEIFLNHTQIDPGLKQVRGPPRGGINSLMPESMHRGPFMDAGLDLGLPEGILDTGSGERYAGNGLIQAVSAG
jgi:hypothetical protein